MEHQRSGKATDRMYGVRQNGAGKSTDWSQVKYWVHEIGHRAQVLALGRSALQLAGGIEPTATQEPGHSTLKRLDHLTAGVWRPVQDFN